MTTETEDVVVLTSYEVMAIISSNVGSDDVAKMIEELKKMITGTGGKITNEDFWGLRDLAYSIKGQDKGYYIVINFQGPAGSITEITKDLKLEQNILRFLLTKTQKNYVFRTLGDLELEAAEYKEKRLKRQEEKRLAAGGPKPRTEQKVEKIEKAEKVEKKIKKPLVEKEEPKDTKEPKVAKKEEVVEELPKKKVKSNDKDILEDFDAKLKSLIDDPDITI